MTEQTEFEFDFVVVGGGGHVGLVLAIAFASRGSVGVRLRHQRGRRLDDPARRTALSRDRGAGGPPGSADPRSPQRDDGRLRHRQGRARGRCHRDPRGRASEPGSARGPQGAPRGVHAPAGRSVGHPPKHRVVAAASRYTASGQQVGGPLVKAALSRTAGTSLGILARVGTRDATNSFKAFSTEFVQSVGIDSRSGFEIGLELTAKARRLRLPVAEVPTIWLDRTAGESNFKLAQWIPRYLRWYRFAFGPRLLPEAVARRSAIIAKQNNKPTKEERTT